MTQNIPYRYNPFPIYIEKGSIEPFSEALYFTAKADSNAICLNTKRSPDAINLSYKLNDGNWTAYTVGDVIELNKDDQIAFSGNNSTINKDWDNYYYFTMTGTLRANGNIQSLVNFSNTAPSYCYCNLFSGCTSLKTAPQLPATTVQFHSYDYMFRNCTNLVKAPSALPALSAADACYQGMFAGCTSLTDAPPMSAEYAGIESFRYMYLNCSKLSSINVALKSWNNSFMMSVGAYWVSGVAESGVFTKPSTLSAEYGVSRIPEGWRVINAAVPTATISIASIPDISWNFTNATTSSVNLLQYITYNGNSTLNTQLIGTLPSGVVYSNGVLSANKDLMSGDYSTTFDLVAYASDAETQTASNIGLAITGVTAPAVDYKNMPFTISALQNATVNFYNNNASNIQYNKNNGQETGYCGNNISLNAGDTVSFTGPSGYYINGDSMYASVAQFSADGNIALYGNIGSLIGYSRKALDQNFRQMFYNNSYIWDVSNLYIDFDEIGSHACQNMFAACSNLHTPPHMETATKYDEYSCAWMFNGSALTGTTPINPSGTVDKYAFIAFYGGSNQQIVNADYVLPSNCNLSGGSFAFSFENNSMLKRGPIIGGNNVLGPAIYGNEYPYWRFYYGCSSLSAIQVQFTDWSRLSSDWIQRVQTNAGIFIKPPALPLKSGCIPSNWTVLNRDSNGVLWNTSNGASTTQYTGDDPYAWYYNQ